MYLFLYYTQFPRFSLFLSYTSSTVTTVMNSNDEQEPNSNGDDVVIARLVLAHLDEIGFKDREVTVIKQRQVKYSVRFK